MSLAEKVIIASLKKLPKSESEFNALKREVGRGRGLQFSNKTELISAYHKLIKNKRIKPNKELEKMLTRRAVRSLSGVAIVTSLTKPYPCPGKCVYCPLDERMPKSYLADEPAANRALALKFDPYEQMARRLEALRNNGHPTDKIELIIKGGTWNAYPLPYQYWFVLQSFMAANGKNAKRKTQNAKFLETSKLETIKEELFRQQKLNENSKHRIIGLTLETRPDFITERTVWQMREMGCTRVELGVQNTSNKILKLIKRGHTIEQAEKATKLLKDYGFKVDFHLMPMLPGATAKSDLAMLNSVFTNPNLRPDMIKIYPCTVIANSPLFNWQKKGKYRAYSTKQLVEIIKKFKTKIPRWCRISRLIRDIPSHHIKGGNLITNLRQLIQQEMKKTKERCRCLRCREAGHVDLGDIKNLTPKLFIDKYQASGGTEYFLSYEDKTRQVVFAFCRLRINNKTIQQYNNITIYPAIIRELHTYGQLISIKQESKKARKQNERDIQHTGLGKKLMREVEKIAKKNKVTKIAVISGIGVRGYYKKLGFKLHQTYLEKSL